MKTLKETEVEFKKDLRELLSKYNKTGELEYSSSRATIEAEDYILEVFIPDLYSQNGDMIRKGGIFRLGRDFDSFSE